MKTLCVSVKVKDYQIITDKAVKIICFDGSEAIIPKSQIFGPDFDSKKSDAYWIAAWILEKKIFNTRSKNRLISMRTGINMM